MRRHERLLLGAATFALCAGGCAAPRAAGPILASERAELRESAFQAVEIREHPEAITYGLIAHDGVLVEPRSPADEAWLLNPDDRALEVIERLNHTVPLSRRSVMPMW